MTPTAYSILYSPIRSHPIHESIAERRSIPVSVQYEHMLQGPCIMMIHEYSIIIYSSLLYCININVIIRLIIMYIYGLSSSLLFFSGHAPICDVKVIQLLTSTSNTYQLHFISQILTGGEDVCL